MYSRTIEQKVICIDDSHGKLNKELLRLSNLAYQGILKRVEADSNEKPQDHGMLAGDEKTEKPKSALQRKFNDTVDFLTGWDLSEKTIELPSKTEYFEPAARILIDEYQDYLKQILLSKKMMDVYKSERKAEIDHPCILLKELLYRFASEILQVHNEKERDGEKVISGFNHFVNYLKKSPYFIGEKGVFKNNDLMILLETIDKWIGLFAECVKMVKSLNANTDGISKGFSFLTTRRHSLMTVLVEKYLRYLRFEQDGFDKFKASLLPSFYSIDLKHVEAISDDNLARSLLEYEKTVFEELFKKGCNVNLMSYSNFSEQKHDLKKWKENYKNSYILLKDNDQYHLYRIDSEGESKTVEIDNSHKLLTEIKWPNEAYVKKHLSCDEFDQLTLRKIRTSAKESSILEFDLPLVDERREHLIIMMDQYAQEKCLKDKNYGVLFLGEAYNLIVKTNQLTRMLEKLASLTKAGGWFIFMSGMVKLDAYKAALLNYSKDCTKFLKEFSAFDRKELKVMRSAMITHGTLSTFYLECQSTDLIEHLNQVTDPEFLRKLACYFEGEIIELRALQKSMNCTILDEGRLQMFNEMTQLPMISQPQIQLLEGKKHYRESKNEIEGPRIEAIEYPQIIEVVVPIKQNLLLGENKPENNVQFPADKKYLSKNEGMELKHKTRVSNLREKVSSGYDLFLSLQPQNKIPEIKDIPSGTKVPTLIKFENGYYLYIKLKNEEKQIIKMNYNNSLEKLPFEGSKKKVTVSSSKNKELYKEIEEIKSKLRRSFPIKEVKNKINEPSYSIGEDSIFGNESVQSTSETKSEREPLIIQNKFTLTSDYVNLEDKRATTNLNQILTKQELELKQQKEISLQYKEENDNLRRMLLEKESQAKDTIATTQEKREDKIEKKSLKEKLGDIKSGFDRKEFSLKAKKEPSLKNKKESDALVYSKEEYTIESVQSISETQSEREQSISHSHIASNIGLFSKQNNEPLLNNKGKIQKISEIESHEMAIIQDIRLLNELILEKSDDPELLFKRAKCFVSLETPEKRKLGISDLALALEYCGENNPQLKEKILIERGFVFDFLGMFSEALADYSASLLLNPKNVSVLLSRGELLKYMGKTDEGYKDLELAESLSLNLMQMTNK